MLRISGFLTVYAALCGVAIAQNSLATTRPGRLLFSAFPIREVYSGPSVIPKFKSATDKNYLGPMLGGVAPAPNLAGRFRLIQFRMGSAPIGAVLVDSKTGTIFRLPLELVRDDFFIDDTDCLSGYHSVQKSNRPDEEDYSAPLSFTIQSELLIVRQCRYDGTAVTGVKWSYYRWHSGKWDLLARTLTPPPPVSFR